MGFLGQVMGRRVIFFALIFIAGACSPNEDGSKFVEAKSVDRTQTEGRPVYSAEESESKASMAR